jgi:hypothetical protein
MKSSNSTLGDEVALWSFGCLVIVPSPPSGTRQYSIASTIEGGE